MIKPTSSAFVLRGALLNSARVGLLASDSLDNWSWYLRMRLFPYQGVRDWWATFGEGYTPDFRSWVNDAVRDSNSSDDAYGIIDPSENAALSGEANNGSE